MSYVTDRAFYLWNKFLIRHANVVFRDALRTPPIATDPSSDVVLFSVLDERSVCPYVLAAKSFLRYCPPANVVIQSDGTLTPRSMALLRRHLPHISFLSRDGTERYIRERGPHSFIRLVAETHWWVELKLASPLLRFPGKYLVLFDSDLLFLRRPDAVLDSTAQIPRRAFHSPGGNGLADAFHNLGFDFSKVDIRSFNAGFFGFENHLSVGDVDEAAARVRDSSPSLLADYEIEQALWAVLLNKCHAPLNLKSIDPDYVGNGWARYDTLRDRAVLVHFVGATRFRNLMYVRLAKRVIRELRENQRPS
jgi:hypothetical protein